MNFNHERAILKQSKSKGASRLILMILMHHADSRGECWPYRETIAQEANCSLPALDRALRILKALGDIEIEPRGRSRASLYRIKVINFNNDLDEKVINFNNDLDEKVINIDNDLDEKVINIDNDEVKRLSILNEKVINIDSHEHTRTYIKREHTKTTTSTAPPSQTLDLDFADCLNLYQNNIGSLNQIQLQDFKDIFGGLSPPPAETRYLWFEYAVLEAASNGVNNWKYCKAILENVGRAGSLAKHKEKRNGQTNRNGSTKSYQSSNQQAQTNGVYNAPDCDKIGAGQTPEMRAKLAELFPVRNAGR